MSASVQAEPARRSSRERRSDDGGERDEDASNGSGDRRPGDEQASTGRTLAELTTLAISALIVLGLVGLTTYFHLTASGGPAVVEVEPRPGEAYRAGQRYYLPVTVRNVGGMTGEDVRIRAILTDPAGRQETATLTIAFLSGGSSTDAVIAFGQDPSAGRLEAGVESYLEP
jgi:uncharacterized protein (TIGR02588 family)